MYCGEVADIIQPLFPIGMKIPNSMRLPPYGTYDDCVFFRGRTSNYPATRLSGHPPYSTALYHTIAAGIHLTPSCGILDGISRYNTSLDCLIQHYAVFGALA